MKTEAEIMESAESLKGQFDALESERKDLVEKRSVMDKRLGEIHSGLVEARSMYRALMFAQGLDVDGKPLPVPEKETKKIPKSKPN